VTVKCLYLQTGVANAVDDRILAGMLLEIGTDPLSGVGRIVTGLLVSAQATPNMTVLVSAGRAICPTPASDGGGYAVISDSAVTVNVPAVSTLPRVDYVALHVNDADYSGTLYGAEFIVVQGTASATPVPPTLPNGYVALATLTHLANASSVANSAIAAYSGAYHEGEWAQNVSQSIASGGDRPIQYPVYTYGVPTADVTKGIATVGATPDARFQLNRAGVWVIDASVRIVGATAAQYGLWLGDDGAGTRFASALNSQGGTANPEVGVSCTRRFPAGYSLVAYAWQSSGSAKNTDPFASCVHFRANWLHY
jgi:hypothetical protein